ncbi:MAG: hypothetical protein WC217_01080 [Candidatus Paceibacterota bacterium]|jgi:hypothetical protein
MKGDTKSDELFYQISIRDDFQAHVRECRDTFTIPEGGLKKGDTKRWYESLGRNKYSQFLDALADILRHYKLSNSFINPLEEYVVTNETQNLYPLRPHPFYEIDTPSGYCTEQHRKDKKPFVSLLIYDYASLEETQEYLKKSWNNIKQSLDKQRGKPTRRIRRWTHKDRDEEILRLYEKSRAELGLKKGEYKQIGIARLIATKYGPIDSDYIKNIVLRRRRLKRGTI